MMPNEAAIHSVNVLPEIRVRAFQIPKDGFFAGWFNKKLAEGRAAADAYIAATHRKPQNEDEARRMSSPLYAANLYGEFFKDAEELQ